MCPGGECPLLREVGKATPDREVFTGDLLRDLHGLCRRNPWGSEVLSPCRSLERIEEAWRHVGDVQLEKQGWVVVVEVSVADLEAVFGA